MQIKVWIRESNGKPFFRFDRKDESYDTPAIQRLGLSILDALEGKRAKRKRKVAGGNALVCDEPHVTGS